MSSQRRKPHRRKQTRPRSNPSLEPHHKKMKLRGAATSPMSSSIIWGEKSVNDDSISFQRCSIHSLLGPRTRNPHSSLPTNAGILLMAVRQEWHRISTRCLSDWNLSNRIWDTWAVKLFVQSGRLSIGLILWAWDIPQTWSKKFKGRMRECPLDCDENSFFYITCLQDRHRE